MCDLPHLDGSAVPSLYGRGSEIEKAVIMRELLIIVAFLVLPFAAFSEESQPSSPTQLVQRVMQTGMSSSESGSTTGIESLVDEYTDIPKMTRRALGPWWSSLDSVEEDRYIAANRALVVRIFTKQFDTIVLDRVAIVGTRRLDKDVDIVAVRVATKLGAEHDILWYVETRPELRIIDVAMDGILLTNRQHQQMATMLQEQGYNLATLPNAISTIALIGTLLGL
jgi:ABC-type transporter MlaC component